MDRIASFHSNIHRFLKMRTTYRILVGVLGLLVLISSPVFGAQLTFVEVQKDGVGGVDGLE